LQELANFCASGVVFGDAGTVEKGTAFLTVSHISFFFKNSDGGQDGRIGQRSGVGKAGYEFGDSGFSSFPENLHQPELRFR
jgi:hypothetical protein